MRRLPNVTTPRLLRKSVSIAPAGSATIVRPVLARVRDGLVLRPVKKQKPATRSQPHEPGDR